MQKPKIQRVASHFKNKKGRYKNVDRVAECKDIISLLKLVPEDSIFLNEQMIGGVYYSAIKDRNSGKVSFLGITTENKNGLITFRPFYEEDNPVISKCPAYILKLLSPTENKNALLWREKNRKNIIDKTA